MTFDYDRNNNTHFGKTKNGEDYIHAGTKGITFLSPARLKITTRLAIYFWYVVATSAYYWY